MPSEFTTLKKGGPQNGFITEAVIYQTGAAFAGNEGQPWIVFASKGYGTQSTLGRAVVYLQQSVFGVTRKGAPSRDGVSNRTRGFALRGQRAQCLLHPFAHVVK
jgi:hypothetical protein